MKHITIGPFFKRGPIFKKNKRPLPGLPGTQQGRAQNLGQKQVLQKRIGYNFPIGMNGATDPINRMNSLFYSLRLFLAKNRKIQTFEKVLPTTRFSRTSHSKCQDFVFFEGVIVFVSQFLVGERGLLDDRDVYDMFYLCTCCGRFILYFPLLFLCTRVKSIQTSKNT